MKTTDTTSIYSACVVSIPADAVSSNARTQERSRRQPSDCSLYRVN